VAGDGPPGLWRTVYPADPDAPEDAVKRAGLLNEFRSTALPIRYGRGISCLAHPWLPRWPQTRPWSRHGICCPAYA